MLWLIITGVAAIMWLAAPRRTDWIGDRAFIPAVGLAVAGIGFCIAGRVEGGVASGLLAIAAFVVALFHCDGWRRS